MTAKHLPTHHLRYPDGRQPRCKTSDIEELLSTRHLESCKTWKSRETTLGALSSKNSLFPIERIVKLIWETGQQGLDQIQILQREKVFARRKPIS